MYRTHVEKVRAKSSESPYPGESTRRAENGTPPMSKVTTCSCTRSVRPPLVDESGHSSCWWKRFESRLVLPTPVSPTTMIVTHSPCCSSSFMSCWRSPFEIVLGSGSGSGALPSASASISSAATSPPRLRETASTAASASRASLRTATSMTALRGRALSTASTCARKNLPMPPAETVAASSAMTVTRIRRAWRGAASGCGAARAAEIASRGTPHALAGWLAAG